ncbi:MAG: hypothetical protein WHV66_00215 [Anaerolineales bacterium]
MRLEDWKIFLRGVQEMILKFEDATEHPKSAPSEFVDLLESFAPKDQDKMIVFSIVAAMHFEPMFSTLSDDGDLEAVVTLRFHPCIRLGALDFPLEEICSRGLSFLIRQDAPRWFHHVERCKQCSRVYTGAEGRIKISDRLKSFVEYFQDKDKGDALRISTLN